MNPCYAPSRNIKYRTKHQDLAKKMRSTPGRWFKVGEYKNRQTAHAMASSMRRGTDSGGKYYGPPIEAQIREESTLWARFPK